MSQTILSVLILHSSFTYFWNVSTLHKLKKKIKIVFQKYDTRHPTKYSMEDCVEESQPIMQSCQLMLPKRPQTSKIILVPLT